MNEASGHAWFGDGGAEDLVPTIPPAGRRRDRAGMRVDDDRDRFPGGGWSIGQARALTAELRPLATTGEEQIGLEMFAGLCSYLDDLGGRTFDRQWTGTERARVRALIARLLRTPSADRLDRPVNASAGLAEGRRSADRLQRSPGWRGGLGRVLAGAYAYLDDLHGPEGFSCLLTRPERRTVAEVLHPVAGPVADTAALP